jgi:NADPH2:quinone reductase
VDDRLLVEVPDGVEDAAAAGVGIAGLAAFQSLSVARLSAGERVLVLGATGAVGQLAVQAAGIIGAGKVVAAGRDAEQLGRLATGPDGVAGRVAGSVDRVVSVVLGEEDPEVSAQAIVGAAGGEVDVIVDPLWGKPALAALIAAAPGGRLVNLGDSAGALLDLPSSLLRSRGLSVIGYTNFGLAPEEQRRLLEMLFEHLAAGRVQLVTEVLPCDKAADAWRRQVVSPHRKLLIGVS